MRNNITIPEITSFSEVLETYGLYYELSGYYWQVGKIKQTQGWILHLSVISIQIVDLLHAVLPILIQSGIPFKIVRDKGIAAGFIEGTLGYDHLGKMVSIYPENEDQALAIAQQLIVMTKDFKGPAIPTDRHLGGIVYTRYGAFAPVVIYDNKGQPVNHIYNAVGQLIPDTYSIPFAVPEGIRWPFNTISTPLPPKKAKLLDYKYYPTSVVKPDSKGVVMKGVYFKKFWLIHTCLLKQGKKNMCLDNAGRDIQDRLQWQYELYQALHNDIPMPEVFGYFKDEEGDAWLAMEFIKGITLTDWMSKIYGNRTWLHLGPSRRLRLLDKLLELIGIIRTMHEKGFIHRDIMPENFLIDRKGRLYFIDMELTWCSLTGQPDPPYQMGTVGHMSPEQKAILTPTIKEDIYGLGGIMVLLFTNIYPSRFNPHNQEAFRESLRFFTGDDELAGIICVCQHPEASERPTLHDLKLRLDSFREKLLQPGLANSSDIQNAVAPDPNSVQDKIIRSALAALNHDPLASPDKCWYSRPLIKEERIGNDQLQMVFQPGWHTGMAGPAWVVVRAKKLGYSIKDCKETLIQSWDQMQGRVIRSTDKVPGGLYHGSAGIAMALAEGLDSGFLIDDPEATAFLHDLLSRPVDQLDLSSGVAGQGIAILRCLPRLSADFAQPVLQSCVRRLIESQQQNGAWGLYAPDSKKDIAFGMSEGVSGVIWFLLNYLQAFPDEDVKHITIKALKWLIRNGKKTKYGHQWSEINRSEKINTWSFDKGTAGIVLVFLRAYEVLKDLKYSAIATAVLASLPNCPVMMDLTLGNGIAGMGEVYLEASRVLDDARWQQRAEWIRDTLTHCIRREQDRAYWMTDVNYVTSADLFTGNSGILHFLLRSRYPERIVHPLSAV